MCIKHKKIQPYQSEGKIMCIKGDKIHPYKSVGKIFCDLRLHLPKKFRHTKVGGENSCEQLRQNVPHTIVEGDANAEEMAYHCGR